MYTHASIARRIGAGYRTAKPVIPSGGSACTLTCSTEA
jgi:hypothetical protein